MNNRHESRLRQITAAVAGALDPLTPDEQRLFLTKLVLLLAERLQDTDFLSQAISEARHDI